MIVKCYLQGLVPRAKQLLALGLTFFLAFGPVILAISLLFSGIFWVIPIIFMQTWETDLLKNFVNENILIAALPCSYTAKISFMAGDRALPDTSTPQSS